MNGDSGVFLVWDYDPANHMKLHGDKSVLTCG